MSHEGTYAGNIVTRYLADTTKFQGKPMSPVAFIKSCMVFVPILHMTTGPSQSYGSRDGIA